MSTTPTPRTDALCNSYMRGDINWVQCFKEVKNLETELAAMTRERDELKQRTYSAEAEATNSIDYMRDRVAALEQIAKLSDAEEGCFYTARTAIRIAKSSLFSAFTGRFSDAYLVMKQQRDQALTDKATLVEALKGVLYSANPRESEHPSMFHFWDCAKQALQKVGALAH